MNDVLQRIINELKEKKLKQKDLTDFLNLSENCFGSWKRNANQSYLKYLHAIAEYLGVSVAYLKGETNIKNNPTANGDEALMFALWEGDTKDVTPEMLNKVREFARFVREEERRKSNDPNKSV